MLEQIEIEPRAAARGALIWLHGLGADGHDFEPLLRQWNLADELAVRCVLPHAPIQAVTLNGGMRMRAWYDIYNLDFDGREDSEGLERARGHLLGLIEREQQRGIDSRRILLAGFSQGAAVALHTALRDARPLAGVLALSGYLPLAARLGEQRQADPESLVVRIDHGEQDPVVPLHAAQLTRDCLQAHGFRVEFNTYPMAHGLCPEQLPGLLEWLRERFA